MSVVCICMFVSVASHAAPPSDSTRILDQWRNGIAWHDNVKVHISADFRSFDGQSRERQDYRKWEYDASCWTAQGSYQARIAGTFTYNEKQMRFVHLRTQYDGEDKYFMFADGGGSPWAWVYRTEPGAIYLHDEYVPGFCFGLGATPISQWAPKPLDLFAPETTAIAQETVDGVDCQVLSTQTPYGGVSVWLAPQYGYNPIKMKIVKESGKDKWIDGTIYNDTMTTNDGRVVPAQSCTIEIVTAKFTEVNGRFVPAEAKYALKWQGTEGQSTTVYSISYSEPDITPKFDSSSFMPDFPDGTSITFQDKEPVGGFEWRNGKIAPVVNEKALANVSRVATGISPPDAPAKTTQQALTPQDLSGMSEAVAPLRPAGRRYYYLGLAAAGCIVLALSVLVRIRQKG